jgi:AraC-like DNA-binding protein
MKILPFKIPKPLNENLIIQIDKDTLFYDKLHQHEEIQVSCIVNGSGKLMISDSVHPFTSGDVFVIGSNMPHLFQSNTEENSIAHMISFFFIENAFGNSFFNLIELEEIKPFFEKAKTGFKLKGINKTLNERFEKLPKLSKLEQFISFLEIIKILNTSDIDILTSFKYQRHISNNEGERMQRIFDYVFNNFQDEVKLENVSNLVFMTPNAFCRYFKQRTNKTFFQFLIELRIEHAAQLLLNNNELPITEIAYKSGFKSISNFNRKFKEIKGTSPRRLITN